MRDQNDLSPTTALSETDQLRHQIESLRAEVKDLRHAYADRIASLSQQLDELTELARDTEMSGSEAGRIASHRGERFTADEEAHASRNGRWASAGDLLWHAARKVGQHLPLGVRMRAQIVRQFSTVYGMAFPHSEGYRAHLRNSRSKGRQSEVRPGTATRVAPVSADGPTPFDVFVFPIIDWHFRHQRPQHLAEQLAERGHRVFYFTTAFVPRNPQRLEAEMVGERIYVISLPCSGKPPTIYHETLTRLQVETVLAGVEVVRRQFNVTASVSLVHHPFWWPVAERLSNNRVVYDCLDHHAGFSSRKARVLELEQPLVAGADLVITTSAGLHARHSPDARRTCLIRNGCDYDYFAAAPRTLLPSKTRPVVGYYGAIAEWFDADLVAAAARALPDCDFVLIGSTVGADLRPLERLSNVHLLNEVPYSELTTHAANFDVCLIPFKVNELTLNTNPVKIYEYFSMGKPVVSVRLPELAALSDYVRLADSAEDFCHHIRAALHERSPEEVERRRAFARQNTWTERATQFEHALAPLYPRISIVVLTYNGWDFTEACLHSLGQLTSYPDWELILVDNASTDGTAQYLEEYARTREYVRVVRHLENRGFAAGNNAGARAARGEYLVFLNNDTYVTRGWLGDLVQHFDRRRELGMLNPVTNNIGNEARIEIAYANMNEMAREALRHTRAGRGQLLELDVCAFFCVMIPRRVWDDVGELDEQFGTGFFEDDDYARRARSKGYQLACAEDVFVHHHLSASFDALGEARKRELFERNRRLFEDKWGPWVPHRYRPRNPVRT